MSQPYEVVIPSHQRIDLIGKRTLALLQRHKIPRERVHVYVATEEERRQYVAALDAGSYGTLEVTCPGLGPSRNEIQRRWPPETPLVFCDDDIEEVVLWVDPKTKVPCDDLDGFLARAFQMTRAAGTRLWGVYCPANPYFMDPTVTYDLRYINGTFYGIFNTHDEGRFVSIVTKEDWQRTLKYYVRDGGVTRFNFAAVETRFYNTPGGVNAYRTEEVTRASCRQLLAEFPLLCSLNTAKKSGHWEVRLRDRRPRWSGGQQR